MPIITYRDPATIRHTTDKDICEALAALAQPPVVEEHLCRRSHPSWWRNLYRAPTEYSVLWFIATTLLGTEYQVVNFYRAPPHTSSNTVVPKELVLAYLYGCAVHIKP